MCGDYGGALEFSHVGILKQNQQNEYIEHACMLFLCHATEFRC
jgi:hypothetical protein